MERVLNALKARADALVQSQAQPRFGTVVSTDPNTAAARVLVQPENVLSGWLPILSQWVGDGWGIVCLPTPGDQVVLIAQEGDAEHGIIIGRAFSNGQHPPPAPVGELWLMHRSGSFIKLQNDGTVQMSGDLHVNGDVYDRQGALSRLRGHYNSHTHIDSRGGQTSAPNPTD